MSNNNNNNIVKGKAFIKYTADKTYEIYARWGFEVSQLFKGPRYIYEPILKQLYIDGICLNQIEDVEFSL